MKAAFDDGQVTLYQGHVLDVLRQMPDKSVQCVICSPPYWSLRSYGTPPQIWGGSETCEHEFVSTTRRLQNGTESEKQKTNRGNSGVGFEATTSECIHCHAWKGELGHEPHPQLFVAHLAMVFHEVFRVLKDDGVLFVNIGDSYAGSGKGPSSKNGLTKQHSNMGSLIGPTPADGSIGQGRLHRLHGSFSGYGPKNDVGRETGEIVTGPTPKYERESADDLEARHEQTMSKASYRTPLGIKPQDLVLVPERLALAVQGFAVISTKEIIELGAELDMAVKLQEWERVEWVGDQMARWSTWAEVFNPWFVRCRIAWTKRSPMPESQKSRPTSAWEHVWMLTKKAHGYYWNHDAVQVAANNAGREIFLGDRSFSKRQADGADVERTGTALESSYTVGPTRNVWNYWPIPEEELPDSLEWDLGPDPEKMKHYATFPREIPRRAIMACTKEGDVVLDPFSGSGTTVQVARSMNRKGIGIELSEEYMERIALLKTAQIGML